MILHITNDYSGSTVYKNLVGELDKLEVAQVIYNPVKEEARIGVNRIDLNNLNSRIIYSHIINKTIDRIFYRKKLKKIVKDIESKVDLSKIKIIHAHTWYSDGGVAYLLSKKYNIPYIVTVRNSDLNVFYKYLFHERSFGYDILKNAQRIVLISASYRQRILELTSLRKAKIEIKRKISIIPNGVDPYWIANRAVKKRTRVFDANKVNVLYIGKFNRGKNVANLLSAIERLNAEFESQVQYDVTLVGGGGDDEERVLRMIKNNSCLHYLGAEHDKGRLKEIFTQADIFAMPSRAETFGLVYVEALLQRLPVIYTKNEGIDGFYDDSIGEKVINTTVQEIKAKIQRVAGNYNEYNFDVEEIAKNHDWRNIANVYMQLYDAS